MRMILNNKFLNKLIASSIIVIIIICLGTTVFLQYDYMYSRPRVPQPENGRIYSLNVHGTIVYLTQQEDSRLEWFEWIGVCSVVVFFLYLYFDN